MKTEAKKIERPLKEHYGVHPGFQTFRYIEDLDKYCAQLTSERDEQLEVIAKDIKIIEKQYQEIKALASERDELKEADEVWMKTSLAEISQGWGKTRQELKGLKDAAKEYVQALELYANNSINDNEFMKVDNHFKTLLK